MHEETAGELDDTVSRLAGRFFNPEDQERIVAAYRVAEKAHTGQVRRSGESYIHHPVAVASIVAELIPDADSVVAALLHDAVEDTDVSLAEIESVFGETVAGLVDGMTKLDKLKFDTQVAQQAATIRKMFIAMAKDIRVIIIKLADRLHNMRTIGVMPTEKRERTAQETLELYAPLAHRLGMQEVKQQLEDLSFAALHPKRYTEIDHLVTERLPEREAYVTHVVQMISELLETNGVAASVNGRSKHLWSIYEKMVLKQKTFDEIYDLDGIRIITGSVQDCYAALGCIHASWTPIQGRFKDYIATPKFNLYQSLHTTVIGPQGKPLEVQIRTNAMHSMAEHGVAAHWGYKDKDPSKESLPWLSTMLDWQTDIDDPEVFLSMLKVDLDQDEVFVFTPNGKVVTLPAGATPVDFAYSIHSQVGDRCVGAKINKRLSPLSSTLKSGDTVEIVTGKPEAASPSQDWLKFVVTNRAKSKIRQWYSRERREEATDIGLDMLIKAMRKEGLPVTRIRQSETLDRLAASMSYDNKDALFAAVGDLHIGAEGLAEKIRALLEDGDEASTERLPTTVNRKRTQHTGSSSGVHVEGLDDIMVRLAQCCNPIPNERIIGYVTKGHGISVHRTDCLNINQLTTGNVDRVIEVDWDPTSNDVFDATIEIKALDRTGLLRDTTAALTSARINIIGASTHTDNDRISTLRFVVEISDVSQMDSALRSVQGVESVFDAYRVRAAETEKTD